MPSASLLPALSRTPRSPPPRPPSTTTNHIPNHPCAGAPSTTPTAPAAATPSATSSSTPPAAITAASRGIPRGRFPPLWSVHAVGRGGERRKRGGGGHRSGCGTVRVAGEGRERTAVNEGKGLTVFFSTISHLHFIPPTQSVCPHTVFFLIAIPFCLLLRSCPTATSISANQPRRTSCAGVPSSSSAAPAAATSPGTSTSTPAAVRTADAPWKAHGAAIGRRSVRAVGSVGEERKRGGGWCSSDLGRGRVAGGVRGRGSAASDRVAVVEKS